MMKKKHTVWKGGLFMKKSSFVAIIVAILLAIMMLSMCTGDGGNRGGDGKSACRNCGRKKPLSSMGYCSTCQEGFNEWQDRYYGND